jgi:hypothetical protein
MHLSYTRTGLKVDADNIPEVGDKKKTTNKTAIINHHVYNLPVKKNGGSNITLIVTSFNMKNLIIIN